MIIKQCGKSWVRIVSWDQLPHVLDHKPIGEDDFSHKRIQWEEFRQLVTGLNSHE